MDLDTSLTLPQRLCFRCFFGIGYPFYVFYYTSIALFWGVNPLFSHRVKNCARPPENALKMPVFRGADAISDPFSRIYSFFLLFNC